MTGLRTLVCCYCTSVGVAPSRGQSLSGFVKLRQHVCLSHAVVKTAICVTTMLTYRKWRLLQKTRRPTTEIEPSGHCSRINKFTPPDTTQLHGRVGVVGQCELARWCSWSRIHQSVCRKLSQRPDKRAVGEKEVSRNGVETAVEWNVKDRAREMCAK